MELTDFDFVLPNELIATKPLAERDQSKLMTVPKTGDFLDYQFCDLPHLLEPGSLLVINDAKVLPARLLGQRQTGAQLEALLLEEILPGRWVALVKKAGRLKPGEDIAFAGGAIGARYLGRDAKDRPILEFFNPETLLRDLETYGLAPLPPYIHQARGVEGDREEDLAQYQTQFAKHYGAVAAPTAGLHMTERLLVSLKKQEIELVPVTLMVGPGTFEPVRVTQIKEHQMHAEGFNVPEDSAKKINQAKAQKRPIVALGTTSLRVLEAAAKQGQVEAGGGRTNIFIYPGYQFKMVDRMVTNFHLPKSTLLMLVAALAGRERILAAYQEALKRQYRFYSFGDAMLIG
ncbi:MAG: tRNA preQ1(34) S-adenosylmethionine ribosyltransferase-isomerase QueA [Candidatus Lambdaproteobacteria bacterium RIFOXYD2_FULL_50_16]|uniref:S-adenosylmethionine:tRNA ribosyltransferase-isomerase n=1 Tax=Candidatus Lambdaproteobacteria bacterium RIFOXYD2_FULL_50_16 TaxID=1817772 RepID=A0A1F6GAB9_9PROT|nr:MAG: tRNA preQ1(34) S-adenosylmethionine ribosyltransferase-isomerase QueA [Candidatus Lambdaproteobacteria bacterium RIFOXYD2_FULL_50_16]